ncbi:hypothetical protein [Curtobacterium sp. MCBD17_040]|uniref:hypothetical protein n=1 Tax=Curtobacterium sp. MCBD17_040 TaxID=2175674 RepID=UPI000DA720BC|nr:hypothetical protein [Curtobacterium sp. MCBD17_040]WIB65595.1 hypothetical protein DEI94_19670 [Curtobacterium sp. MCBD17_040]
MPKRWPLNLRPKGDVHHLTPTGIAALLDDADNADTDAVGQDNAAVFDDVMDQTLGTAEVDATENPTVASTPAPEPTTHVQVRPIAPVTPLKRRAPEFARRPGDLVYVFGLRDDARTVAEALQAAYGSVEVVLAGTYRRGNGRHIEDRREMFAARADGVRTARSFIVAVGLGVTPADADLHLAFLDEVIPDQVWLAVDVTRKPEDTSTWAHTVAQAADGIDAVAALGVAETTTPDSTDYLGIPVGWMDAQPSAEIA